jgi:two-component system cell cycle sensor histidine kinase/response regulator CckA
VTPASDGVEALERLTQSPDDFQVLVTDVAMPGLGGVELARRCAELKLQIPIIFVSAYAEPALADQGLRASQSRWLKKPFSSDDLLFAIRRILDGEDEGAARPA